MSSDVPEAHQSAPEFTIRLRRALERAAGMAHHESEITTRLLGEAILLDSECAAARALRSLGIDVSSDAGQGLNAPGSAPANSFTALSAQAVQALDAAQRAVGSHGRLGTSELLLGILETDPDWVSRLMVQPADYRARLAMTGPEA